MKKTFIKNNGKYSFILRENTLDRYVFNEIFGKTSLYRNFEKNLNKTDVVLDIGGHIGLFSTKISESVKSVILFEPEKQNFQLALKNSQLNTLKNITLINKAVIGNNDISREFFINDKKNTGMHRLKKTRGRRSVKVNCVRFSDIIQQFSANKVKLDVEGGEYEILKDSKYLSHLDEIILEFHPNVLCRKTLIPYYEIVDILQKNFNHVILPDVPMHSLKKRWGVIIHAKQ